jgi:hypothetical protein
MQPEALKSGKHKKKVAQTHVLAQLLNLFNNELTVDE